MAKLNGPLGSKLRGKVGEVVAAKTLGGGTAIRAYQPKVKNPRTQKQVNNRSAFTLLSKVAAQLADVLALNAKRGETQRNAFIRNNFKFVEVSNTTSDDGTISIAKLPAMDILLTNGGIDIAGDISFDAVAGEADKLKIVDTYDGADALGLAGAYVEVNEQAELVKITPFSFASTVADKVIDSPAASRTSSVVVVYRITSSDANTRAEYLGIAGNVESNVINVTQHSSRVLSMSGVKVSATAHLSPTVA